ncbi:hypothetical protein DL770_009886 [Monosporascus sp. CRB-9-2]|nr:hypothetical protein DL770_009886 [Monosporascus sp. CRB-9-2]
MTLSERTHKQDIKVNVYDWSVAMGEEDVLKHVGIEASCSPRLDVSLIDDQSTFIFGIFIPDLGRLSEPIAFECTHQAIMLWADMAARLARADAPPEAVLATIKRSTSAGTAFMLQPRLMSTRNGPFSGLLKCVRVEDIIDVRVTRSGQEYQARWKGSLGNGWYPGVNVSGMPYLLREFHKENPHLPGPPKELRQWEREFDESSESPAETSSGRSSSSRRKRSRDDKNHDMLERKTMKNPSISGWKKDQDRADEEDIDCPIRTS